jgi:phenylalanine-4-hydroxylase
MFGANTTSELRGDYSQARADFTVDQAVHRYTEGDQALWRTLYRRQSQLVQDYACAEFIRGLDLMDAAERIPDLEKVSDRLEKSTGWRLVAVPGFIPDAAFFTHLAARRFPVTVWLRKPEEMEYLVEPDIFHDFFGHAPMLFQKEFADYVHQYGQQGLAALQHASLAQLARVYWYTVEFGLIRTPLGLRAYGAGILSSAGETVYAVEDPRSVRVRFELERCMRTRYMIDDFQKIYFVIDSLSELAHEMSQDLQPVFSRLKALADIEPDCTVAGDRLIPPRPAAHKLAA